LAAKQAAVAINDRARTVTAIRFFIMRGIPAERRLGVNINSRLFARSRENAVADAEFALGYASRYGQTH
jgi:hypothetical protein